MSSFVALERYKNYFDIIIVDECHRVCTSAKSVGMFYKVVNTLAAPYKYGLSATVHRADGMIGATFAILGNVTYTVPDSAIENQVMPVRVDAIYTNVGYNDCFLDADGTMIFAKYINYLAENTHRNNIAAEMLAHEKHPCFAFSKEALPAFEKWLAEASALIRSLDPNHLISIGSEGAWGCEGDFDCWERITADKNIDYANIHLWPYNWGWAKQDSLIENLPRAKQNTKEYIDRHLEICERIKKPLVMEEFGYPRDDFKFALGTPTKGRDGFYDYVFALVGDNAEKGGCFAGCNFWGWGGFAQPKHEDQWQVGDDYTGDPAQEAQGLNSVFANDTTTLSVVKEQVARMNQIAK